MDTHMYIIQTLENYVTCDGTVSLSDQGQGRSMWLFITLTNIPVLELCTCMSILQYVNTNKIFCVLLHLFHCPFS